MEMNRRAEFKRLNRAFHSISTAVASASPWLERRFTLTCTCLLPIPSSSWSNFFLYEQFFAGNFFPTHFFRKVVYFDNYLDFVLYMITSNNVCSLGNQMGELINSVSMYVYGCVCVCVWLCMRLYVCDSVCVWLFVCGNWMRELINSSSLC